VGSSETVHAPLGILMPWGAVVGGRSNSVVDVPPVRDATEIAESLQQ